MRFTDEQMKALEAYEPYFDTAVRASWSRAVPRIMMETLHRIWEEAIGRNYPFVLNCQQCQLNLLRDAGTVYFAQKEEARKVELAEEEPAKPVRKKKVTTKR